MAEEPPALKPLLDLFVYAPIGMLYEYPDVLDTLVKRGKSQIQLAKLMGQMAKGSEGAADVSVEDVVGFASELINRVVGDVGDAVASAMSPAASPTPSTSSATAATATSTATTATTRPTIVDDVAEYPPLSGYDDLTAKAIVALLPELSMAQRINIRRYERGHKNRKTVLAATDRLAS